MSACHEAEIRLFDELYEHEEVFPAKVAFQFSFNGTKLPMILLEKNKIN